MYNTGVLMVHDLLRQWDDGNTKALEMKMVLLSNAMQCSLACDKPQWALIDLRRLFRFTGSPLPPNAHDVPEIVSYFFKEFGEQIHVIPASLLSKVLYRLLIVKEKTCSYSEVLQFLKALKLTFSLCSDLASIERRILLGTKNEASFYSKAMPYHSNEMEDSEDLIENTEAFAHMSDPTEIKEAVPELLKEWEDDCSFMATELNQDFNNWERYKPKLDETPDLEIASDSDISPSSSSDEQIKDAKESIWEERKPKKMHSDVSIPALSVQDIMAKLDILEIHRDITKIFAPRSLFPLQSLLTWIKVNYSLLREWITPQPAIADPLASCIILDLMEKNRLMMFDVSNCPMRQGRSDTRVSRSTLERVHHEINVENSDPMESEHNPTPMEMISLDNIASQYTLKWLVIEHPSGKHFPNPVEIVKNSLPTQIEISRYLDALSLIDFHHGLLENFPAEITHPLSKLLNFSRVNHLGMQGLFGKLEMFSHLSESTRDSVEFKESLISSYLHGLVQSGSMVPVPSNQASAKLRVYLKNLNWRNAA
jgi:hypothetical protein